MGEVGRGTSYIVAGKIIGLVIAFIHVSLVPRYLGPSNMGFYSYWMAVFFIFSFILDLSAAALVVRFVPELKETDKGKVPVLLIRLIKIKFYFAPAILLIGILFFRKDITYFLIIFLASLIMAITNLLDKLIYSYGRMRAYTFYKISQPTLRILLLICAFALFKERGIILAIITLNIIMCLGMSIFTWRILPHVYDRKAVIPLKNYFGFSIFAYLGSLFFILIDRMAMVFSKQYILDMRVIGCLGFSMLVCLNTIRQVIGGVSESILPYIVKFKALDRRHTFNRSLEYSWRYTNMLLFPLVFALLMLARPGIEFIVGREYLPSVRLIFLLLPAIVFYSWVALQQNELFAEGKARHMCCINLVSFLLFCVGGIVLIKRFGEIGAVLTISLTGLITFMLTIIFSVQRKNISFYYGGPILRPLAASLIMAGWLNLFEIASIWRLLGIGISGIAVYGIVMLVIKGITRDDINRMKEALFVPQQ